MSAEVKLIIPAMPEYVGVARLAVLGVASRMRFSYDEVEDIRLAVGEACARAIEGGHNSAKRNISLACTVTDDALAIEVRGPAAGELPSSLDSDALDPTELGGVLIRILMHEVEISEDAESGEQVVRMLKRISEDSDELEGEPAG